MDNTNNTERTMKTTTRTYSNGTQDIRTVIDHGVEDQKGRATGSAIIICVTPGQALVSYTVQATRDGYDFGATQRDYDAANYDEAFAAGMKKATAAAKRMARKFKAPARKLTVCDVCEESIVCMCPSTPRPTKSAAFIAFGGTRADASEALYEARREESKARAGAMVAVRNMGTEWGQTNAPLAAERATNAARRLIAAEKALVDAAEVLRDFDLG